MVDQDDEGLRLDELVHHLLKHQVGQQQQDAPQKIVESTADQHQAVLGAGPETQSSGMTQTSQFHFFFFFFIKSTNNCVLMPDCQEVF